MKLLRMEVEGLALFKDKIELDFFTDQRVFVDNAEMVDHLFGNVYTNNVLSFVGINASGKTSILKVISFVMSFFNGNPVSSIDRRRILENSNKVNITLYAYYDVQTNTNQTAFELLPRRYADRNVQLTATEAQGGISIVLREVID